MSITLAKVLTIPEVAELAGWTRERMWRHLKAVNTDLGGMLLRNTSRGDRRPRWTISISALKAIAPQWFQDAEAIETRIVALESRMGRSEKIQDILVERLAELAKAS